ncbi:MAG: Tn3 family transposase, partial [Aggregatilineales bacterium]
TLHVERKALAIYSQLKSPSSSEVASMIEGIMRHATAMQVGRNYVDTHGQSEIAFAFSYLLGFELLPRFKNLAHQKLYRPDADTYPNLEAVLAKTSIDWELIEQQYDLIVQYAVALRLGTADAETILKRFMQTEIQHPAYRALAELGKVIKTLFLCHYLSSEALRREIDEGLNIIENWNSANDVLGYGRSGEFSGRRLADQEVSMLTLQLLQNSLIYINTLLLQQVLAKPYWFKRMTEADWRALTPLFYAHISLYGTFTLDMDERIPIERAA